MDVWISQRKFGNHSAEVKTTLLTGEIPKVTCEMTNHDFCCNDMAISTIDGLIRFGNDGAAFFVHPNFVPDGGGHIDDMTTELEFRYCPFCGKKLA